MSKISLEEFEKQMEPVVAEVTTLNARSNALHKEFVKLANSIEVDEEDEDAVEDFRDKMFEYASNFIDGIDYEYSRVEPGSVQIWQASTC